MFTAVSFVLIVSVFAGAMLLACQSWRLRIRFSDAHVLQQGIARRALDRFLKSNIIRRRVRLLSSNRCVEPITYGLLSWTIVLLSGTDQRLGREELKALLAHEVAHSWMGNLVTNQTWQHFWMNEGFTVFVERKVTEIVV